MRSTRSIVLVDDDREDHEIFISACAVVDSSVKVVGFESGDQAFLFLSSMSALPDVIFLDLNMPRRNGIEVLTSFKNSPLKSIPVVIYTTSYDARVKEQCAVLGATEVMEKPSSFDKLCKRLQLVLQALQ